MIYTWKNASFLKADAQEVGETLEELRKKNKGKLTPPTIVRAAKPKKSPFHNCFEWDDTEAARQHREEQARYLMRHIAVVYEEKTDTKDEKTVRAYVNVREDGERAYQSVFVAMKDPVLKRQILLRALQEMDQFRKRYEELEEFQEVFIAVDKIERPAVKAAA